MHRASALLSLLALCGTAAAERQTMSYMYCQNVTQCDSRTKIAVKNADALTTVVMGSNQCRTTEYTTEGGATWCNYVSDYSTHIKDLQDAGIQVMFNSAGVHHFGDEAFYKTDGGIDRMVDLAVQAGATGWALDLEEAGIPLDVVVDFFTRVQAKFKPKGLKLQYTCGGHFASSMNFTSLVPIVDYVFSMNTYKGKVKTITHELASVPAGMMAKYVPGLSDWASGMDQDVAERAMQIWDGTEGLDVFGYFTLTETQQDYWFPLMRKWLGKA
eukprot:TRINITY_DN66_c1_g1_i1.p1 TRINITY_DN66_c1_g1~~TRINITY_DN66_c1_g1_i1.p1  ORF type:complete len:271 (+),score=109.11 TRINITY_DN66_c1_g1_i1:63-875(+)